MTLLTYAEMQTIVSLSFHPEGKLFNHRLEPISKDKRGIFGTHLKLYMDINYEGNNKKEVKSLTYFVKTKPDKHVQSILMDDCIFNEEVYFYDKIQPQLLKQIKCEKWSPRCYLSKYDILIFENLFNQDFKSHRGLTLEEKYVKSALTTLARFHASSMITEARLGNTLDKIHPGAFKEKAFTNLTKLGQTTHFSFETLKMIMNTFGMDTSLVPKIVNNVYQMVETNTTGLNVICHADLWTNNLMFDEAEPPNCILVDYQLVRYHSPALDLAMLLFLNTTPEFKRKSEISMIKHYHSTLKNILVSNEYKLDIPTYEKILDDYRCYKLYGAACAVIYLPGLYLQENFLNIVNDSDQLTKWCLENRMDLINLNMDTNPTYKSMLKDIIDDFMEVGKQLLLGKNVTN